MLAQLCLEYSDDLFHAWYPVDKLAVRAICAEICSPTDGSIRSQEVASARAQVGNGEVRIFGRTIKDAYVVATLQAILEDTCNSHFLDTALAGYSAGIIHPAFVAWATMTCDEPATESSAVILRNMRNTASGRALSLCRIFARGSLSKL
jgi:hypothetical protein